MTLLLVANPKSGRGKSLKVAESFSKRATQTGIETRIISELGIDVMLASIRTALSEPNNEIKGVISIGGDGLLHELLPIIVEFKVPFTVVPTGTGNDFAREIGTINKSIDQIIKLVERTPKQIDSVEIISSSSKTRASQVLSLGFDALVNERANSFTKIRGKAKYVIATLLELPVFKPIHFDLTIDGKDYSREAMLIAIANGPSYGGGMKICPQAKFDDGFLDILILSRVSIFELIKVFPRVYTGRHVSHPAIEIIRGREITVNAPAKVFADGEFVSNLPVSVRVDPASLSVWK